MAGGHKRAAGGRAPGEGSTPATLALAAAGVRYAVHAYDHDPAAASYGLEAAQELGRDPAQVFKTLLLAAPGGRGTGRNGLCVVVVPVDRQVDLKAAALAVGAKKAALADARLAERVTGYQVGGISPFGQKRALPTLLDDSAAAQATILVSGGRRGVDVEVDPEDLLRLTGGTMAPLGR